MVELIGQDIDTLMGSASKKIVSKVEPLTFSDKVVSDLKPHEVIKVTNQNNQIYWVLGGVALLTVIGGAYYLYRKNKKENEDSFAKHKHEIDKLKSDFHNFFEEAERKKSIKPIRIIRKKKAPTNPYFNS